MTITAIYPAFNNEISIGTLVLQTKKHADHVVVVDDGSTDRTAKVALLAGAEVIRHADKKGKAAALMTGFEYVGRNRDGVIFTMDTDRHHDYKEIPRLASLILKGKADVVNISRCFKGSKNNKNFYYHIIRNIIQKASNSDTKIPIEDKVGLIAFARHALPVLRSGLNRQTINCRVLSDAANAGLRVEEVEVGAKPDEDCSTENPSSYGVKVMVKMLEEMELSKPLFYFTIPGMICSALGMGLGLNFLRGFYLGESLRFGPTLFMIVLTMLGVFMAFTGIILHSVSRLIIETKNITKTVEQNRECI